jgi:pimeloyl-ACP methyl ester carboxylesterase
MVVLLPGLGADSRLFDGLRPFLPPFVVPAWPTPAPSDTIRTFAGRLAATIPRERPIVVGGSSFGGMVALELAHLVGADAVVLIGSARSVDGIHPVLRRASAFAPIVPLVAFRTAQQALPARVAGVFGARAPEARKALVEMFAACDPAFLRWGCTAIAQWSPPPQNGFPILSIHGARDGILPVGLATCDHVVKEAGHLLPMTHPQQTAEAILRGLARLGVDVSADSNVIHLSNRASARTG